MGWARCEPTPDSIPTMGNTRIESRAQDSQRSSRLFKWMGSFAWKFCKPAACLVPWPGALVPLRAFTLTWIDVLVVACPSNHYCITTICSSTAAAPDKTWTSINHHTLESKIKTEHTSAGSILQIWKCYKDSSKTSSHIGSPWLSQIMYLKKSQELRTEEYRLFDLTSSLLGCRRIRPYVTCKVHWGTQVQTSTGWCSRDVVM